MRSNPLRRLDQGKQGWKIKAGGPCLFDPHLKNTKAHEHADTLSVVLARRRKEAPSNLQTQHIWNIAATMKQGTPGTTNPTSSTCTRVCEPRQVNVVAEDAKGVKATHL